MDEQMISVFCDLVQDTQYLFEPAIAYEMILRGFERANPKDNNAIRELNKMFIKEHGNPREWKCEGMSDREIIDEKAHIQNELRIALDKAECELTKREVKDSAVNKLMNFQKIMLMHRLKHLFWRTYRLSGEDFLLKQTLADKMYNYYTRIDAGKLTAQSNALTLNESVDSTELMSEDESMADAFDRTGQATDATEGSGGHENAIGQRTEHLQIAKNEQKLNALQQLDITPKMASSFLKGTANHAVKFNLNAKTDESPILSDEHTNDAHNHANDYIEQPQHYTQIAQVQLEAYNQNSPHIENVRFASPYQRQHLPDQERIPTNMHTGDPQSDINIKLVSILDRLVRNSGQTERFQSRDHSQELIRRKILYTATNEGQPIDIYFGLLKQYINSNNVSEVEMMNHIQSTLKNGPLKWYWASFVPRGKITYLEFHKRIHERFEDILDSSQLLLKATELKYVRDTDVLNHVDQLTTMMTRGNIPERTQVIVIRNSLTDEMRRALMMNAADNVLDTISCLKQLFPKNCRTSTTPTIQKKFPNEFFKSRTFGKLVSAYETEQSEPTEPEPKEEEPEIETDEIEQLCAVIRQFGQHRKSKENGQYKSQSQIKKPNASQGKQIDKRATICFNCKKPGHWYKECTNEKTSIFCYRCGKADKMSYNCDTAECEQKRATQQKN